MALLKLIFGWLAELYTPTCILKYNDLYFIVDCWNNRILYSKYRGLPVFFWGRIKNFNRPHKLIFLDDYYYICDTDNHRIVKINRGLTKRKNLAEHFVFDRPHDIHVENGILYVVDGLDGSRIITIDPRDESCSVIAKFPAEYMRSLYFNSHNIFACSATSGNIYILDKISAKLIENISVYASDNKFHCIDVELQLKVGESRFVPNSIIYYEGFWYLTNYFYKGAKNRFVRFENWIEFKNGNFKDLSSLVKGVPYFMSIVDECLALGEIDDYSAISFFSCDDFGALRLVQRI